MANEENLKALNTRTEADRKRIASMGGKASAKKRRERKTIADALRKVLDEPIKEGSKESRLDAIAFKSIKNLYDNPSMKGLKALAEILGEVEHKVTTEGTLKVEEMPKGLTKEQAKDFIASLNK